MGYSNALLAPERSYLPVRPRTSWPQSGGSPCRASLC